LVNSSNFAERLTELMEDHGLNNFTLEQVSGCPNTTISAWLTKNVYPKPRNLVRLSDYFECSIDYLLGLTDDPNISRSAPPATFAERINSLAKTKGITFYRIYTDCKIPNSYFSRWLHQGLIPEIPTLIKIAEYLNCSVEYLLGLSDRK